MNFSEQIQDLIVSRLSIIREVARLVKQETQLAGMNIVPLLARLMFLLPLLIAIWLSLMVLCIYGLANFAGLHFPVTIFYILIMNVVVSVLLIQSMFKRGRRMLFSETRALFTSTTGGNV